MTNAGQTCIGVERVYVADAGLRPVRRGGGGQGRQAHGRQRRTGADIGPITMPSQIDIIRRHIDDALARGGTAVLGGADAVQRALRPADRAGRRARGLLRRPGGDIRPDDHHHEGRLGRRGGTTGQRHRVRARLVGLRQGAGRGRSPAGYAPGWSSINGTLSFAGHPAPARSAASATPASAASTATTASASSPGAKAIARRRMRSFVPSTTFERQPKHVRMIERLTRLVHGR